MSEEESWEYGLRRTRRNRRFRRAQTACRRCRAKKTKCDNKRPTCGFCLEHHTQCVYGDIIAQDIQAEPTIRNIFDRVNDIAKLLESGGQSQLPELASAGPGSRLYQHSIGYSPPQASSSLSPPNTGSRHTSAAGLSPSHAPRIATPAGASFESTLKWPIFRGLVPVGISSLVLQTDLDIDEGCAVEEHVSGRGYGTTGSGRVVLSDESNIRVLCQRYLQVVHVKNPIFEVSRFNVHVKGVLEHGLDWDEGSCVVMLACALASAVKQVEESSEFTDTSITPTDSRYSAGDAYFLAAKKRLGLLELTLTSAQCFFLAGLYEMCRMRPASAWTHYSQACGRLQVILSRDNVAEHGQSPNFHVLERLFFSCYRTELDLREELPLPSSGVASFEFPSEFPSPPPWTARTISTMTEYLPPSVVQHEEEQSWYYYLASIALRKEANSIIHLLYRQGEQYWLDNVEHSIHQAALHEGELDQWRTLLPDTLKFDTDQSVDLAFILECRLLHWRQILYRPLLYYALNHQETDPHFHRVLPSAQKCLEYCALTIRRLVQPHHYEGTWFIQRAIATATLLVLAAQIRGPPLYVTDWKLLVSSSLQVLAVWKTESQDLARARLILERLSDRINKVHE